MLEGVVEDDGVDIFSSLSARQLLNASGTLLIDSHRDAGELAMYLVGLVTDITTAGVVVGKYETLSLSLVAATEHGYVHLVFQEANEVFDVRRLARSSNRDVTYGNDRCGVGTALQDARLEEHVPDSDAYAVKPAQWSQALVDGDEVAFHERLFYADIIQHAGLNAAAVLDGLANLHKRFIEFAEQHTELTVKI